MISKKDRSDCPIYLDYHASTPMDPRVFQTLMRFSDRAFGNPHSLDHAFGWRAADVLREARAQVAGLISADDEEIIFTSGATESCNLAIRGAAKSAGKRNAIVTPNTEHPAVLETARALQSEGFIHKIVEVQNDGRVDLNRLAKAIDDQTFLVSVMLVNNEIGVLQSLTEIAEITHQQGALFHTDASQAAGRMPIDVDILGIDLLTLSGHKVYAPQGTGCLYIRDSVRKRLSPILTGGGQERGLRSGTVPVALAAAFGNACEIAIEEIDSDRRRIDALTKKFLKEMQKCFPEIRLHGHADHRIPGNLNLAFRDFSAQEVIEKTQDLLAFSSGSACSSIGDHPSHVITALGFSPAEALQSFRISIGRFTTESEIDLAIQVFQNRFSKNDS